MRDCLAAATRTVWREEVMEELEKLLSRYTKSLALCGIIICIGMMVTGITGNDNAVLYSFIIALRVETILLPIFIVIYLVKLLFGRRK